MFVQHFHLRLQLIDYNFLQQWQSYRVFSMTTYRSLGIQTCLCSLCNVKIFTTLLLMMAWLMGKVHWWINNLLHNLQMMTKTPQYRHHVSSCLNRQQKLQRSPDGATTDWGVEHLTAAHYSFIDPELTYVKLSWSYVRLRKKHVTTPTKLESYNAVIK